MKIFWSWQSDTPAQIGKYLVRDALRVAINRLKQAEDIDEPTRDDLHLDQDTQGATGSPDLVPTIFGKIEKSEVVVADVTIVGKTDEDKRLINSNVAIEFGLRVTCLYRCPCSTETENRGQTGRAPTILSESKGKQV